MATRQGPTKGSRVLVKLPFAEAKTSSGKNNAGQHILIKSGVAKYLGFEAVNAPKKIVEVKVLGGGVAKIERQLRGAYKQRSVKLIFKSPVTITGKSYKSVSLPLCSGASIADVADYFESGAGKSKKVIALITPHGQRIPLNN